MSRLAVLWSEASFRAKAAQALREHAVYTGVHLERRYQWLKGRWAYLGVNGARHCLWRLGLLHTVVDESWLHTAECDAEVDVLIVPEAESLEPRSIERLQELIARGRCWVIIAGATNLPDTLLGVEERSRYLPKGFVKLRETRQDEPGSLWRLPISPPGYPIELVRPRESTQTFGRLEECELGHAEASRPLPGHAFLRRGRLIWIPLPIFEYLGGLLQAHVDWWPLHELLGFDAVGYIDRLCHFVMRCFEIVGIGALGEVRLPPWGSYQHAVIFRHDTDDSLDATFWDIERRNRLPATYAVLADQRAHDWVKRLEATPQMETALHYRTNYDGLWERLRMRLLGRLPRPDQASTTHDGLLNQVRQTRSLLGDIKTIHRHYHYVYYPELLLALDTLYEAEPSIIGSNSFARFHLFRYGGAETVRVMHPHLGVPFSFPIRPVIATVERHASLRGWESTAFIEPDQDMLGRCVRLARECPGGCYTWVFHPAHARRGRVTGSATLGWFQAAHAHLDSSWWVTTAAMAYARIERWSRLTIRKSRVGLELSNPSPEPLTDVVVRWQSASRRIDRLEAHQTVLLARAGSGEGAEALEYRGAG